MSKMIQIRNVPNRLHGKLKARAARSGMSLSEYLIGELEEREIAEIDFTNKPTLAESRKRLNQYPLLDVDIDIAD
jgi:hypothetical protein